MIAHRFAQALIGFVLGIGALVALISLASGADAADSRFAHQDSDARYVHHIELYDADNRKITAESTKPYSSVKTCGRCHDYDTISHGWHFNAFDLKSVAGRAGEPWIWTDLRTGTQLPLSYRRGSSAAFDPRVIPLTPFEMTHQFGGRIPGGGFAEPEAASEGEAEQADPRWKLSGSLSIDCMVCHAVPGAYDFNQRREQIDEENFAWAATAGLRLGQVDGKVSRIKAGSDPDDEATQAKLPKVSYDAARFAADGTVFMDLIRHPDNNACFQCHSTRTVGAEGIEPRWMHDEDVHLRAGMACVDCHRNGIDHHITRGFPGEENPSGQNVETLSCAGCHLGATNSESEQLSSEITRRAGRLGSPMPLHEGLPPVHFEKMTCTACHSGPVPRDEALQMMTSLSHGLGTKEHRSGFELPSIAGPVFIKNADGKLAPNRAMWPAFWGIVKGETIEPISPTRVYDVTRKTLRVRKDFVAELLAGEEDQAKFDEKVSAALEALEKDLNVERAAYVANGKVYQRGEKSGELAITESPANDGGMLAWPIAHNVRPAGWSLGVGGCLDCHSDQGKVFTSTVAAIGPGPTVGTPVTMAALQGIDPNQRLAWNDMFSRRKLFKYIVGASISILVIVLLIGIGAFAARAKESR